MLGPRGSLRSLGLRTILSAVRGVRTLGLMSRYQADLKGRRQ